MAGRDGECDRVGLVIGLRPGLALVETDGGCVLRSSEGDLPLANLSPGWNAALHRLAEGAPEQALTAKVMEQDGLPSMFQFTGLLRQLAQAGLLCYTVRAAEGPLATLLPISPLFRYKQQPIDPAQPYRLSRFAYCRGEAGGMVLETPLGHAKLLLLDSQVSALVAALARAQTCAQLATQAQMPPAEAIPLLMDLLLNAAAAGAAGPDGTLAEEEGAALGQWDFHDLLFHARSRQGRHRYGYGGTYRGQDRFKPSPAIKPRGPGEVIALYQPDLPGLRQTDVPLTAVLEDRRSRRNYGPEALTSQALGEFLFRSARVKQVFATSDGMDLSRRPYPAGGAAYELEIYPVVGECQGLQPGLYHYRPQEHELQLVTRQAKSIEAILEQAWATANQQSRPQVCLVITARFQRLQWKYESIAYSLVLKHVGVLYQTMYLVATAMGLAPCALGGGNADIFAAAAGLDYYVESSVGEFLLGSRAPDDHDAS